MYIVIIGWLYVALMMFVAEATSTAGSIFGAMVTFLLYGLLPLGLLAYIMATPARKRALKAREAVRAAQARARGGRDSDAPDAGGEAAADAVAPVRKEP